VLFQQMNWIVTPWTVWTFLWQNWSKFKAKR
jgi:hypothetical protein